MARFVLFVSICLCVLSFRPAQAEKNLTRPPGTTRYEAMVARLMALQQYDQTAGHRMELTRIGQSVEGRALWMVTLADPASSPTTTKRLLYLCRQHGHEPASTEAALQFVDALAHAAPGTPLANCLRRVTVYVIPMANPDGAEHFLRHNAHDVDLNRDWIKQSQPETQALAQAIRTIHPDLMTDQHELYPTDHRPDYTETAGPQSGAPPEITALCSNLQNVVQDVMTSQGYSLRRYQIDSPGQKRLAHGYGCLVAGVPTILFETNRSDGRERAVGPRAAAHEEFMTVVLRDLAGEQDQMLAEAGHGLGHQEQPLSKHLNKEAGVGAPQEKDGQ